MALLDCAPPRIAIQCLHTLQQLFVIRKSRSSEAGAGRPEVDIRLSAALLTDPGVMNPLAKLAMANISESPGTDMEWAGFMAALVLDTICASDGTRHVMNFRCMVAWGLGRYSFFVV